MFQNYSQPKSYIIYLLFFLLCIICVDTYAQPCYAIAVDDVEIDIKSHLVEFDIEKGYTKYISELDANIKAVTVDPATGKIYTARFNEFGTLNPVTGKFEKISNLGSMKGEYGTFTPDSIRAMAFNPFEGAIYAVDYNFSSPYYISESEDLLFRINPTTGEIIKESMYYIDIELDYINADYAVVETPQASSLIFYEDRTPKDVWDLTIHPNTGELFTYYRTGPDARLSIIDLGTGEVNMDIVEIYDRDYLGISISRDGHSLYLTSGSSFGQDPYILFEMELEDEIYAGALSTAGFINAENYFFKSIDCSLAQYLPYQPCKFELAITNMMEHQPTYEAQEIINSNLYVNHDTEFYAGTAINLFPGFEVNVSKGFGAYISNCN